MCVEGDKSSGSEVCISVRYYESMRIVAFQGHKVMMRFPSLAGKYAEFVGSRPCLRLIVEKCRNEMATKLGGVPFRPQ